MEAIDYASSNYFRNDWYWPILHQGSCACTTFMRKGNRRAYRVAAILAAASVAVKVRVVECIVDS